MQQVAAEGMMTTTPTLLDLAGSTFRVLTHRTFKNALAVMPRCKLFRVGRSRTGLGLFATMPIAKGMAVVEYKGRRLSTREAHEREQRTGYKYMFELNSRWSIDGSSRRNLARYVNHACFGIGITSR